MDTIQSYITLIKDTVTCLAALVAAYVAITGLQTWKRQLTANAEYDLARRVLVAVYKVRDAIEGCRTSAWEGDSEIVDVTKRIHELAFTKLEDATANLDVELLEAQAVWGDEQDYRNSIVLFRSLERILKGAYWEYYLPDPIEPKDKKEAYLVLFTNPSNSNDEFSRNIDRAVKRIEDLLRPKLTLKQGRSKKKRWWHRFKKSEE